MKTKKVKAAKKEVPKKKVAKVKAPPKIPTTTLKSAAFKSLKWKLKAVRVMGSCIKQGCGADASGIWCKKHKKILRKRQLKLNNIPWRAKVKKQGKSYKPDQIHVVYKRKATKFTLKNKDKAIKRVKAGQSVLESVKELEAAIVAAGKNSKSGVKASSKKSSASSSPSTGKKPAKKPFKKPEIKTVKKPDPKVKALVASKAVVKATAKKPLTVIEVDEDDDDKEYEDDVDGTEDDGESGDDED